MKLRYKVLGAGLFATAMVVAAAAPAFAQDCVVVNRSTQGAIGASHSSRWALLDVNAGATGCGATPTEVAEIDAALGQAGLPLVFDTRTDKVLPDNGHGIQHIDTAYIPIIAGVSSDVADCLGS